MTMDPICEGKGCPLKEGCMRHKRPMVDMRTRYQFLSPPYKDGDCTAFIKNNKLDQFL
jgi:hypothetical protein